MMLTKEAQSSEEKSVPKQGMIPTLIVLIASALCAVHPGIRILERSAAVFLSDCYWFVKKKHAKF